jgi:hypothetical protein
LVRDFVDCALTAMEGGASATAAVAVVRAHLRAHKASAVTPRALLAGRAPSALDARELAEAAAAHAPDAAGAAESAAAARAVRTAQLTRWYNRPTRHHWVVPDLTSAHLRDRTTARVTEGAWAAAAQTAAADGWWPLAPGAHVAPEVAAACADAERAVLHSERLTASGKYA